EDYRYYLEVKDVQGSPSGVRLNLQSHKFDPLRRTLVAGGAFEIELASSANRPNRKRDQAKNGKRGAKSKTPEGLTGHLMSGDENRGELTLQWISTDLRRAGLRIIAIEPKGKKQIRIPGESLPGRIPGWKKLFAKIGWQLAVSFPKPPATLASPPPNEPWTPFDLGLVARELRNRLRVANRTRAYWIYDLLCVSKFDQSQFLGVMFDAEATDLNQQA